MITSYRSVGPPQIRPRVLVVHAHARVAQVEPAPPERGQLGVDLDPVHRRVAGSSVPARAPWCRRRCRGSRPRAAARSARRERQHEELVPVVAGQVGARAGTASGPPGPRSARACGRRRAPRRRARTGTAVSTSSSTMPSPARLDRAHRQRAAARRSPPAPRARARRARPVTATIAQASPKTRNVRRVPTSGISRSADVEGPGQAARPSRSHTAGPRPCRSPRRARRRAGSRTATPRRAASPGARPAR